MQRFTDVVIVGGGIVGLATAYRLLELHPTKRVVVLEKEDDIGLHQTSHNSGVLHSGIYYTPRSLRALNCRDGRAAMVAFCEREGLPFETCGKVIVAVDEGEIPRLRKIYERGETNGVRREWIGPERLREMEPHASGVAAIHVPDAGIVDFHRVAERLAELVRQRGGEVRTGARVYAIRERGDGLVIETTAGDVAARLGVTCGGLHSDRLARLSGVDPPARIVPFRGEYYTLTKAARHLCRNLIYPVPNAAFPFLGVHLTRMVHGGVECGPNAVLAFAREGYTARTLNLRDLAGSLSYPGLLRLLARHWREGAGEVWRSLSKKAFVTAVRRLVPEIDERDLVPAPAGVRAQALNRAGRLVEDFLFVETARVVNVCNAPSPAATASLNIGGLIVEKLAKRF